MVTWLSTGGGHSELYVPRASCRYPLWLQVRHLVPWYAGLSCGVIVVKFISKKPCLKIKLIKFLEADINFLLNFLWVVVVVVVQGVVCMR